MKKLSSFKALLGLFILFILGMLVCRAIYTGSMFYFFLLWNLFLGWIPFQMSLFLPKIKSLKSWPAVTVLAGWLLFFPNALYVITDLIHLESKNSMPLWYDALMIFTAAIAGLMMAFASLYKVERFLRLHISSPLADTTTAFCLFVGSFGVYVGRFLRWNSWDIVAYPLQLLKEIAACFYSPVTHYRSWLITLIFTCFFNLLYFTIKKLPGLIKEPGN